MKKFYFTLALMLIFGFTIINLNEPNYNTYADTAYKEYISIDDLETFLSRAGNNRSAYSRGEKTTASYLAEIMQSLNLSFYNNQTNFLKEFNVGNNKSQNVIGVKKSSNPKAKRVILGAHYDNAYILNGEQTNSNGVFDNASGVLCLISIMKELSSADLPFDLVFIFYGAEETGLNGSKNFVNSMSSLEKKNTLLAFNFDSIGVGDETYFYSGDSANSYKKIFKNNTYNINEMPLNKRINILTNFEGYAYTHIGLLSDNSTYLKNNIRCTTFFSGNLTHSGTGYIESSQNDNISHTNNDNLTFILSNYPNFLNSINNVVNLTINTLKNPTFVNTVESSNNDINLFFFNNKFVIGSIFFVGLIMLISIKPKRLKITNEPNNA
ncbi:MAG: M28 family metallopeptidase [Christensenellales bacterium]